MDNYIYFQLKEHVRGKVGQDIYLEDIAEVACSEDIVEKVKKLVVLSGQKEGINTIKAVDIIKMVNSAIPRARVLFIGASKISIHMYRDGDTGDKNISSFLKAALTSLLLFIGSGLAIMYFHADVNMHEVHGTIYTAITGEKASGSYWISIPYSIGIGLGIALFFGILPNRKKPKTPDPLKIGMYKYKKDIDTFLEDKVLQKSEEQ